MDNDARRLGCFHGSGSDHVASEKRKWRARSIGSIEGGALTIRNGFTHYPQKQETYRFFKGELVLPERIIMLDESGSISFDVLAWLSEQRVSLIQINWKG